MQFTLARFAQNFRSRRISADRVMKPPFRSEYAASGYTRLRRLCPHVLSEHCSPQRLWNHYFYALSNARASETVWAWHFRLFACKVGKSGAIRCNHLRCVKPAVQLWIQDRTNWFRPFHSMIAVIETSKLSGFTCDQQHAQQIFKDRKAVLFR